ncbi:MerR family transcriptional regulator [Paenibacillus luteus]|uniref:MerR family transcriptional regulator n=1 Tax=Paenibacillus luteus TaxID=2545753 RepID=UPI0011435E0D|nr:MerR family transcriptional regulator [Paenibacillus luteus]
MKVHEAAKMLGVTPRTLRFYEEKGLITPYKALENRYRDYSEADLIQLRWIISLRELGLPLSSIQDALSAVQQPDAFLRKVEAARKLLYESWITATKALQALDETISVWEKNGNTNLHQLESAAEEMKQNRMLRASWSDLWNYDDIALQHGYRAPLITLNGIISEEHYNLSLHKTIEWLDPRHDEIGLELGAGSGNLSVLVTNAGAKLTVVEQSAEMLSLIRERLPDVDAKQGNLLALPLAAQSYSFIVCTFAMHHLTSSQQLLALAEMDRVLLNGGRIVITGLMNPIEEELETGNYVEQQLKWCPSSAFELANWLNVKGYSTLSNPLGTPIGLLYACKP